MRPTARALVIAWLAFQMGGVTPGARATGGITPGTRVLNRLEQSVTRPLPPVPTPEVKRPDRIWVPDRYLSGREGLVHVPGHWERRVTDREAYVPPLVVCGTGTGECVLVPAGTRPLTDTRQGP